MTKKIPVQPLKKLEDVEKVNNYLKNNDYTSYILWSIGINTGLRVSDILKLNVEDVKGREHITIIEQKTQKPKKFPIIARLKKILDDYIKNKKPGEPLINGKHGGRLNRKCAWRKILNACLQAGIKEHVGTHTMRKTFGYHHYQQFHDAIILQKIFNHSSLRITLIYIGVEQDEIDQSYQAFNYSYTKKERKKEKREYAQTGEKAVIKFLENYINSGQLRHKEFAELALCQMAGEC